MFGGKKKILFWKPRRSRRETLQVEPRSERERAFVSSLLRSACRHGFLASPSAQPHAHRSPWRERNCRRTQMFVHYTIVRTDFSVSHYCLRQTIRAESDLLQLLSVSHYLSVIPHLSLLSSTPAFPRFQRSRLFSRAVSGFLCFCALSLGRSAFLFRSPPAFFFLSLPCSLFFFCISYFIVSFILAFPVTLFSPRNLHPCLTC